MQLKSEFLQILSERGFIHQVTDLDGLDALMSREKITAYIGFDCTAPSLHVGNLMQIMTLRWLQKTGHKPIVLMGGGTTKIGDPSGKDESRKLLTDEQITANMNGIKRNFEPFIDFADEHDYPKVNSAVMVNNDDWLKGIDLIEFLRDYGRHFSVNRMLTMDSVKLRIEREHHLSFLELTYMLMQAYDFVELNKKYDCRLQIGGSDQWGNIVMGVDLFFKRLPGQFVIKPGKPLEKTERLFGLTTPLITTASGAKMGKTEKGAVWLDPHLCSSFDYWQFWRNTEDADVWKFMRFFTELDIGEIARMEKELHGAQINEAKKILATEATALLHGREAAQAAAETARKTFEQGAAAEGLPTITLPKSALGAVHVRDLLVQAGLAPSNSEAKKLIQGNGVRLNDEPVTDVNAILLGKHLNIENVAKLSKGKKHHVLIRFE